MTVAALVQARMIESWQYYQECLLGAIEALTDEQIAVRLVPGMRSSGEIAEHIVYGRAFWVNKVLPTAGLEPFISWEEPSNPPRTAAEVRHGLVVTWQAIRGCLDRWAAGDTSDTGEVPEAEVTRLQTIWGLMEHDLHHGGEMSCQLGALGLPALEF
jgi:uncharacterized damage-inducible protein DinB